MHRLPTPLAEILVLAGLAVFASPASASDPLLFQLLGENPGGAPGFGHSVDGGQDVDGDGVPDVIVGGPYENAPDGQAKVVSGADASLILLLQSSEGGQFGNGVAMVGDVSGDGVPDLAVGAPQFTIFNQLPGYAEVRSGADGSVLHHWDGVDGRDQFGDTLSAAGDVDGDGVPDVIVGAPLHDGNGSDSGMARVFAGDDGALVLSLVGSSAGGQFGTSVDGLGDVDGDGLGDVIVGAPKGGPGVQRGRVQVVSGGTGAVLATFDGPEDYSQQGYAVAGVGDVDADGVPDQAYGAPGAFTGGVVEVRSGVDGALLHVVTGPDADGNFGRSVAGAGDVDGDGFADVLVGAHTAGAGAGGRAAIVSGRDGATLRSFAGAAGDKLGESCAGAGDVDGDGFADVIVGADQFSSSGPGYASVWSGRPALTGDVRQISLAAGGALTFSLCAPSTHAGGAYWIFGSISGFAPGLTLPNGVTLPLVPDLYFDLTLQAPILLPTFVGTLDGDAEATATLAVPAGLDPALAGLMMHHAFLARRFGETDVASNPALLELVP